MKKENTTIKQVIAQTIDKVYNFYENVPDYKTGVALEQEYVKKKVGKLAQAFFK